MHENGARGLAYFTFSHNQPVTLGIAHGKVLVA
jgi:hypothetical protein